MNSLLALMHFYCLNKILGHLSNLTGLWVIVACEDHEDIAWDEPLCSPAQSSQSLRPDIPANGLLAYTKIGRRLGYSELFGHGHVSNLQGYDTML